MCYAHLTRAQRYQIEQLLQADCSVPRIASKLGVRVRRLPLTPDNISAANG